MKVTRFFAVFALASPMLLSQAPAPAGTPALPIDAGSIVGHVYLGRSHSPARIATVTLFPVVLKIGEFGFQRTGDDQQLTTELDGSFKFGGVPPGKYYVLAETPGYISPIHLPCGMIAALSKEDEDSLSSLLPVFTVVANRATDVEIVLPKGAAVTGRILFDDGEPYSEAAVVVMRKDKSGKWGRYETGRDWRLEDSDDRGNFRIAGLPTGEYLLKASLTYGGNNDGIDVYYGKGIRRQDANVIQVKEGEESGGNNIVIPLRKLHAVSGTVIGAETGEMVMAEFVELHDADDDSRVAYTNAMDGEFRFPYVAEGEYTLKLGGLVKDLTHLQPWREYQPASQPIAVHGEMNGVTIRTHPKPVDAQAGR